jgi:superfamily I DNA/RNA helicase
LKRKNCLDFDDLLGYVHDIFRHHPETGRRVSARFKYVLVDEFQDTSTIQYEIAKGLASAHQNLFIVGDPDQSIYSWRFARVENLGRFRHDFKPVSTVKLETNYRSSSNILHVATRIIGQDERREKKSLIASHSSGHPVLCVSVKDNIAEAKMIAEQCRAIKKNVDEFHYGHAAVLYRTNKQSRVIEEEFVKCGLPYRMIGGLGYYERREVKDLISYMRFVGNIRDEFSLERIINVPSRGIGDVSIAKMKEQMQKMQMPWWSILSGPWKATKPEVADFVALIDWLRQQAQAGAPSLAILDAILEYTNYAGFLEEQERETIENRKENIEELREACYLKDLEYTDLKNSASQPSSSQEDTEPREPVGSNPLDHFLTHLAMISGDPREGKSKFEKADTINLMTMHAAKGLEWPVVFVVGCDSGAMPTKKADNPGEERRLLYVSVTRAQALLYISWSRTRVSMFNAGGTYEVDLTPFIGKGNDLGIKQFASVKDADEEKKNLAAAEKKKKAKLIDSADWLDFGLREKNNSGNELLKKMCSAVKIAEMSPGISTQMSQESTQPAAASLSSSSLETTQQTQSQPSDPMNVDTEVRMRAPERTQSLKMLETYFTAATKWVSRRKSDGDVGELSKKRSRDEMEGSSSQEYLAVRVAQTPPGTSSGISLYSPEDERPSKIAKTEMTPLLLDLTEVSR